MACFCAANEDVARGSRATVGAALDAGDACQNFAKRSCALRLQLFSVDHGDFADGVIKRLWLARAGDNNRLKRLDLGGNSRGNGKRSQAESPPRMAREVHENEPDVNYRRLRPRRHEAKRKTQASSTVLAGIRADGTTGETFPRFSSAVVYFPSGRLLLPTAMRPLTVAGAAQVGLGRATSSSSFPFNCAPASASTNGIILACMFHAVNIWCAPRVMR